MLILASILYSNVHLFTPYLSLCTLLPEYFSFSIYLCAYIYILLFLSIPLPLYICLKSYEYVSLLSIFTSGKWPSSTILSASSTIKNRMPLMSRNIGISSSVISSHKRPGVATKICTGRLWLAPKNIIKRERKNRCRDKKIKEQEHTHTHAYTHTAGSRCG